MKLVCVPPKWPIRSGQPNEKSRSRFPALLLVSGTESAAGARFRATVRGRGRVEQRPVGSRLESDRIQPRPGKASGKVSQDAAPSRVGASPGEGGHRNQG